LQWNDEVHQADDKRHAHEEDHDRAMGGKDLVIVLRRKVSARMEGQGLLRAHHGRVGESAKQHHQRQQAVHHANTFVIDAGDPLTPKIRRPTLGEDEGDHAENDGDHQDRRRHRDRLVQGQGCPTKLAEHPYDL
jgi:hypothetical protein